MALQPRHGIGLPRRAGGGFGGGFDGRGGVLAQRFVGALFLAQGLGHAAIGLGIGRGGAGTEIIAEDAGDDAIHVTSHRIGQIQCGGEEQQRQPHHADDEGEDGAHRALGQAHGQVTQGGDVFGRGAGLAQEGEAARREPPEKAGEGQADEEDKPGDDQHGW